MENKAIKAGDIVQPTSTFDFGNYNGPKDLDDRGLVLDVVESNEGNGSLLIVGWRETGTICDHVAEGNTGHPDDNFADFGVEATGETFEEVMAAEAAGEEPVMVDDEA